MPLYHLPPSPIPPSPVGMPATPAGLDLSADNRENPENPENSANALKFFDWS